QRAGGGLLPGGIRRGGAGRAPHPPAGDGCPRRSVHARAHTPCRRAGLRPRRGRLGLSHLRPSRICRLARSDPEQLTIGEMSASRSRAVLGRVALVLASLIVTVLVLEGLLRIAVPQWRGLVPQRFMTST